jgi:hypothetical protein
LTGRAGNVVPSSFGGDAVGAILPTGPTWSGHHCVSVTAVLDRRVGPPCRLVRSPQPLVASVIVI